MYVNKQTAIEIEVRFIDYASRATANYTKIQNFKKKCTYTRV